MISWRRTVISGFLVVHLVALAFSAIPSPADLAAAVNARASSDDWLSGLVRPPLDAAAAVLQRLTAGLSRLSGFTSPVVATYVARLGLNQTWNMFGNPPRGSEYVRFRYFWTRAGATDGALTLSTELVFPAAPAGEARLLRSYWLSQRDKAVSNAVTAYHAERTRRAGRGRGPASDASLDEALSRTFLPMVGHFSDQFSRTRLAAGDRLVRVEVWYGWGESRRRGEPVIAPMSRDAVLEKYSRGVLDEPASSARFAPLGRLEREADIQWIVLDVRTP
jgi:hypothetical protein